MSLRRSFFWPGPGLTAAGWTDIDIETPGTGGVAIYVDDSRPDNTGNGFSAGAAKKTTAAAVDLLNTQTQSRGHRLLFKRGETWTNQSITGSSAPISRSGASADDPLVIGYYGTGARPHIKPAAGSPNGGIPLSGGAGGSTGGNYFAIIGIHFDAYTRNPDDPGFVGEGAFGPTGIANSNESKWFLVEDCKVEHFGNNMLFQTAKKSHVLLRRSILNSAYPPGTNFGSGVFFDQVSTAVIEENIFHHNGWEVGGTPTIFDHNVYCKAHTGHAWNNISTYPAANGIQWRGQGGISRDNLFVRNPVANLFAADAANGCVFARAYDNVVLEGTDIGVTPHAYGLNFGGDYGHRGPAIDARRNIIAHEASTGTSSVGVLFTETFGANASDNIFYKLHFGLLENAGSSGNTGPAAGVNKVDLGGNNVDDLTAAALGFPDAERSVGAYAGTIGLTATLDAFIAACLAREIGTWDEELTANAVNNYIRAGFGMAAVRARPPHRVYV